MKNELYSASGDEQLARLATGGNRAAFEALYERYFSKLCWFATGILRDTEKSKDVVQEVFIGFIDAPQKFDSTRTFSTWIYTATKNRCLNVLRNENNRNRINLELSKSVQAHNYMDHAGDLGILQTQVERALSLLNERNKVIFRMRFDEGHSIREIAAAVRVPEGTVKSAIFHILKKISLHLKEFIHEQ